jgi:hypothetical protein
MEDSVNNIALLLNLSTYDIYVIFIVLIFFILFLIIGIAKIYEVFFWMIFWIFIFIILQYLLLHNSCNTNLYIPEIINQNLAKFIISSSIYLIFILSILMPLNWFFNINIPKNFIIKIIITFLLSIALILFYISVIIGFIEKIYIFNIDSVFIFMKNLSFWENFASNSKIYAFILPKISIIVLIWILFSIYKLIFGDMINMLLIWFINSLKNKE